MIERRLNDIRVIARLPLHLAELTQALLQLFLSSFIHSVFVTLRRDGTAAAPCPPKHGTLRGQPYHSLVCPQSVFLDLKTVIIYSIGSNLLEV